MTHVNQWRSYSHNAMQINLGQHVRAHLTVIRSKFYLNKNRICLPRTSISRQKILFQSMSRQQRVPATFRHRKEGTLKWTDFNLSNRKFRSIWRHQPQSIWWIFVWECQSPHKFAQLTRLAVSPNWLSKYSPNWPTPPCNVPSPIEIWRRLKGKFRFSHDGGGDVSSLSPVTTIEK